MTNLQRIRREKGLTQQQLSDLSKVKLRSIQHYEIGFHDINKACGITLYQLCKVLKCNIEDLLELNR